MLFKEELLVEICKRNKTQTRRPIHPDETLSLVNGLKTVHTANGRIKWQVGRDYAAQYGRGLPTAFYQPENNKLMKWSFYDELLKCKYPVTQLFDQGYQHLRLLLTNIRIEDVRNISRHDAQQEGFTDFQIGFWNVWTTFYDSDANLTMQDTNCSQVRTLLKSRPDNLYLGWALTFKIKED